VENCSDACVSSRPASDAKSIPVELVPHRRPRDVPQQRFSGHRLAQGPREQIGVNRDIVERGQQFVPDLVTQGVQLRVIRIVLPKREESVVQPVEHIRHIRPACPPQIKRADLDRSEVGDRPAPVAVVKLERRVKTEVVPVVPFQERDFDPVRRAGLGGNTVNRT
jgi:hypothetical protein